MILMNVLTKTRIGLAGLLTLALTACGTTSSPQTSDQPQTIAAPYPFVYALQRIAGDHAGVESLIPAGVEAHDFELTPRQIASLSQANLVVYQQGYNAAIDTAMSQATPTEALDTGTVVTLLPAAEGHTEDDGHDHSEYGYDPHIWLNPQNLRAVSDAIADRLATLDAAHADDYRANAAALDSDLTSLDADFKAGLANCRVRAFIPSHAAFGYLTAAYDLQQLAIAGITPEDEPSPAKLAELQQLAAQYGITTVFSEPLASSAWADTLARDAGLTTAVLDPLEGLTDASAGSDYLGIMRANLAALQQANGCV